MYNNKKIEDFFEKKPDVIFHLIAQPIGIEAIKKSLETLKININKQ